MARIRAQTGGGGLGITPTSVSFYDVLSAGGTIAQMAVGGGLTGTWTLVNSSSSLVALSAGGLLTRGAGAATTGAPIVSFTSTDGNTILQIPVVATVIVATLPANTVLPALSPSGAPVVGVSVTATPGTWTGNPAPTFAYQWRQVDTSTNISGATSATYTPVSGDVGHTLTCVVTATNIKGSASASAATSPAVLAAPVAPAAPVNTVAPGVPSGSANVGSVLTASTGTWTGSPTPTYTYQWFWFDAVAPISGATSSTYTPVSGDVGHTISVNVTATNGSGAVSASSAATAAVTATPAMPSGALGIWYADQAVTAGRKYIPNAIKGSAPTFLNQLSVSRRHLADMNLAASNVAITDNAAAGADGKQYAATVVGTGNFYLLVDLALPAGTWTFAYDVKRNTTTDQQFIMKMFSNGLSSPTKTATSTWTRVSWTVTTTITDTAAAIVASFDGATGANVQIDNWCLVSGSVDPANGVAGVVSIDANPPIYFGRNNHATDIGGMTAASNVATLNGVAGVIQFPDTFTMTDCTVVGINKRNGSGWTTFMGAYGSAWQSFEATQEIDTGPPVAYWNGRLNQLDNLIYKQPRSTSSGHSFFATRFNASGYTQWYDTEKLFRGNNALASISVDDFLVNTAASYSTSANQDLFAMAFYNRSLTDQEVLDARSALLARATTKSVTVNTSINSRVVVFEGDSITAGVFANTLPYPKVYSGNASPVPTLLLNYAVSGSQLGDVASRAAQLPVPVAAVKNIYVVQIGTNDLGAGGTGDPTSLLANLATHLDGLRTAGWKVVLATIPPRAGGNNSGINTFNTTVAGWGVGLHYDAFVDYRTIGGADAGFQDPTNATYWQTSAQDGTGGLHPTNTGAAAMEAVHRPVLNAL